MKKYRGAGLEGIPPAPLIEKAFNRADQWFEEMKVVLANKIPQLTQDEVNIKSKPYHEIRLHEMHVRGYRSAASEFQAILKKEKRERKEGKHRHQIDQMEEELIKQTDKLKLIIDVLCRCQEFENKNKYDSATVLRKEIGEKFLKSNDFWLAKHFFNSALQTSLKMVHKDKDKYQAEIHCLLAFLARDTSENLEKVLDAAITHLIICRKLAKSQPWQFRPNVLTIRLKKPITLHGLRNEFAVIDGCSMTLYMIATLLEHEILIGLASQIIHPMGHFAHHHHHRLTEEDLARAHKLASHALKLAYEVRQNDALLSALMRYGVVLRHCGQFDEAMIYFQHMIHHAEITGNQEAYAIGLQHVAHCLIGKKEASSALENLGKEKAICEAFNLEDLEGDNLKEFGHLLLVEGHLWEAEECYFNAFNTLRNVEEKHQPHHSHLESSFVFLAIASGQTMWSRFSCLARSDEYKNLLGLMEFKNRRTPLPSAYLNKSFYKLNKIEDIYVPFVPLEEEKIEYVQSLSTIPVLNTLTPGVRNRAKSVHMVVVPQQQSSVISTMSKKSIQWDNEDQEQQQQEEGLKRRHWHRQLTEEVGEDNNDNDIINELPDMSPSVLDLYNDQMRKSLIEKKDRASRKLTAAKKQKESLKEMLADTKMRVSKYRKSIVLKNVLERIESVDKIDQLDKE